MSALLVFLGGGAGALCRYGLAHWLGAPKLSAGELPWATLLANFLACLLLGGALGYLSRGQLAREGQLLLVTGFCGGFSTFSTFAGELVGLTQAGQYATLVAYLLLSLLGGVASIAVVLLLLGR